MHAQLILVFKTSAMEEIFRAINQSYSHRPSEYLLKELRASYNKYFAAIIVLGHVSSFLTTSKLSIVWFPRSSNALFIEKIRYMILYCHPHNLTWQLESLKCLIMPDTLHVVDRCAITCKEVDNRCSCFTFFQTEFCYNLHGTVYQHRSFLVLNEISIGWPAQNWLYHKFAGSLGPKGENWNLNATRFL